MNNLLDINYPISHITGTLILSLLSLGLTALLIISPSSPKSLSEKERSFYNQKTGRKAKFPYLLEKGTKFSSRRHSSNP
jgi:hypothetical protein